MVKVDNGRAMRTSALSGKRLVGLGVAATALVVGGHLAMQKVAMIAEAQAQKPAQIAVSTRVSKTRASDHWVPQIAHTTEPSDVARPQTPKPKSQPELAQKASAQKADVASARVIATKPPVTIAQAVPHQASIPTKTDPEVVASLPSKTQAASTPKPKAVPPAPEAEVVTVRPERWQQTAAISVETIGRGNGFVVNLPRRQVGKP